MRVLADRLGITPSSVRKRIGHLVERGVINEFVVQLSRAMLGYNILFALLYTDKSIDDDTFADMVFSHEKVTSVRYDSFGSCVVHAEYASVNEMHEISAFFRRLESVNEIEVHTLPFPPGGKKNLTEIDLRVLAPLLDDPRMRVSDIARISGLTVRRVRRTLDDLIESNAIQFTIDAALTRSDAMYMAYRVQWDDKSISIDEICRILETRFPSRFLRLSRSALEPIAWIDFLIEHNSVSEIIVQELRKIPSLDLRNTIMVYPPKKTRLVRQIALRKKIEESGVISS